MGLDALLDDRCRKIRDLNGYSIVVVVVVVVIVEEEDGRLVIWVVVCLLVIGDCCSSSNRSIGLNLALAATQLAPHPLLLLFNVVIMTGEEHRDVDLLFAELVCLPRQSWVLDLAAKALFLEAEMSERFWGSWKRTELISSSVVSESDWWLDGFSSTSMSDESVFSLAKLPASDKQHDFNNQ